LASFLSLVLNRRQQILVFLVVLVLVITYGESDPTTQSLENFGPFTPLTVTFYGYDVRNNRTFVKQPSGGTIQTTYTLSGLPRRAAISTWKGGDTSRRRPPEAVVSLAVNRFPVRVSHH
jgi:hypothetical protein